MASKARTESFAGTTAEVAAASSTSTKPVLVEFEPARDVHAFIKFTGLSIAVLPCAYFKVASTGYLPQLQHGRNLVGREEILPYLNQLVSSRDATPATDDGGGDGEGEGEGEGEEDNTVTQYQSGDVMAYTHCIQTVLYDALLYAQWQHESTYEDKTRRQLIARMVWPLGRLWPWFLRREIRAHLERHHLVSAQQATRRARNVYEGLEARLSNTPYLFGTKPTMADAALYGHLVGAARTPLLGQLLAGTFPAVLDFYDRTRSSHFPDDPPRPKPKSKSKAHKDTTPPSRFGAVLSRALIVGAFVAFVVAVRFAPRIKSK